ncbi:unnamed protein product [Brassicogethes aeneus]|uniref:Exosome complex component 10 homolog n=1 Tax=Brassicogethes aeneus TaxID=1431903 RepID=A0A9P0FJF0_BRAAE|nr:unnamed protein product [Brassicogethes aeneus]
MASGENSTMKSGNTAKDSDKNKEILPGYKTIEDFTKEGFKSLVQAIKHSNALPGGRDWSFYKTHDAFKKIMSDERNTIQKLINTILRANEIEGSIRNRIRDEATEVIIEANDQILEKVAGHIDEMNGIRKSTYEPIVIQAVSAELPINGSWNRVNNATFSVSSSMTSNATPNANSVRLLTAKNIIRPQSLFRDKINNALDSPWEPKITDKPNSLKPLAIFLEQTENGQEFSHPYEFELERFTPSADDLFKEPPQEPRPTAETPLIEISTPEQLTKLVKDLRKFKVIAIDLEHHSYRSFMGITCLMQISTTEKDYLIDTLALRDNLHVLNEIFTKSSVVKVFHGAESDIQWLQRDLSLYIVNMFDTFQAAKLLDYSRLSLAYLLNRFCNFMPNKQFQLADWRIRPLPEELKSYAREDTHYLIYIYQKLKEALYEKANGQDNLLKSVFQRSRDVCLRRYFKPVLREDSYMDFYRKCKRMFDNRQLYALKELYKWRDTISREEDESTGYVLPNHMLLQIAESLPREMHGVLACCNPIPPLVKANLLDLHHIVLKARDQPLNKAILQEDTRARGQTKKVSKINVDSPLNCPHDLTKASEFRDDLPTLLNDQSNNSIFSMLEKSVGTEKTASLFSVFNTPENSEDETTNANQETIKFLAPYQRYTMVKPFIQAEEERLQQEKEEEDQRAEKAAEEERSDAQRIESVKQHYMELKRQTVESQSLIEMGGTRKRKRRTSGDDLLFNLMYDGLESNIQTPVPIISFSNNQDTNRNKRKSGDNHDNGSPSKLFKIDSEGTPQKQQQQKNKGYNNKKNKNKNQKGNQGNNQEPKQNKNNSPNVQQGGRGKNRNNRNRTPNRQQNPQNQQGQNNFTQDSFDYSSVDYRQFQGGASGAQKPKDFQSHFRPKGKGKGQNKGFNRSQTFGGAPKWAGSRGGGRGGGSRGRGGGSRGRGR